MTSRVFWRPKLLAGLLSIPAIFILTGAATALVNAKDTFLNLLGFGMVLAAAYLFICIVIATIEAQKAEEAPPVPMATRLKDLEVPKAPKSIKKKRRK